MIYLRYVNRNDHLAIHHLCSDCVSKRQISILVSYGDFWHNACNSIVYVFNGVCILKEALQQYQSYHFQLNASARLAQSSYPLKSSGWFGHQFVYSRGSLESLSHTNLPSQSKSVNPNHQRIGKEIVLPSIRKIFLLHTSIAIGSVLNNYLSSKSLAFVWA